MSTSKAEQAFGIWDIGDTTEPDIYVWAYRDGNDTEGKLVATVNADEYDDHAQQEAYARLIAAAPDLLAACEAQLAHLSTTFPPYPVGEGPMDKTRAAVAKARVTT